MNYIIEGEGALVNEAGEKTPLKAGDFALVNPTEKHHLFSSLHFWRFFKVKIINFIGL